MMVPTGVRPEFGSGDDYPTEATPMPEHDDIEETSSPFEEERQDDFAEPGPDVDGEQQDAEDDPENAPDAPDPEQAEG